MTIGPPREPGERRVTLWLRRLPRLRMIDATRRRSSDAGGPKINRPTVFHHGTVNLAGPTALAPRVVGRDDETRSHPLRRVSVPGRNHRPCRVAVFPLPAWSAHGGGVAGRSRHHRQP